MDDAPSLPDHRYEFHPPEIRELNIDSNTDIEIVVRMLDEYVCSSDHLEEINYAVATFDRYCASPARTRFWTDLGGKYSLSLYTAATFRLAQLFHQEENLRRRDELQFAFFQYKSLLLQVSANCRR